MISLSQDARILLRALALISELDDRDLDVLSALPARLATYRPGDLLVRQGEAPNACCLLLEGMLYREKTLAEGERQILSIHLPGEIPDLQSLYLDRMNHGLAALTPSRVAFVPHTAIRDLADRAPRVRNAFWRASLIDGSIFREWLAGVGARTADERAAHMLAELYFRSRMLGLAPERAAIAPLTRQALSAVLGVSAIHASRVVTQLRALDLISVGRGHLRIEDWPGLRRFARLDPAYLHYRVPAPSPMT